MDQKEVELLIVSWIKYGFENFNDQIIDENFNDKIMIMLRMAFNVGIQTIDGLKGQEFYFKFNKITHDIDIYFDNAPSDARKFKI